MIVARALLLGLALACGMPLAHSTSAQDQAEAGPTGARLRALLPEAGADWSVEDEIHSVPDPELRAQGLLGSALRRFSRARGPVTEVCSVELWSFAHPSQAKAVGGALQEPQRWVRAHGTVLVLAHSVRLERHRGTRHTLFAECEALAQQAHRTAESEKR